MIAQEMLQFIGTFCKDFSEFCCKRFKFLWIYIGKKMVLKKIDEHHYMFVTKARMQEADHFIFAFLIFLLIIFVDFFLSKKMELMLTKSKKLICIG